VEPEVMLRDEESGARGRGGALETRLAFDTEIVPKVLFGGVNLIYGLERFRPRGVDLFNGEGEKLETAPTGPCPSEAEDQDLESCVAFSSRKPAERSSEFAVSGAL